MFRGFCAAEQPQRRALNAQAGVPCQRQIQAFYQAASTYQIMGLVSGDLALSLCGSVSSRSLKDSVQDAQARNMAPVLKLTTDGADARRAVMRLVLFAMSLVFVCIPCQTEARNMNQPRIDKLFEKTKTVCFGRFLVDVPSSAAVVPGLQTFGPTIESLPNGAQHLRRRAQTRRDEVQANSQTYDRSEVVSLDPMPTGGSWTLRYWASDTAKLAGLETFESFLAGGAHGFLYKTTTAKSVGRTPEQIVKNVEYVASHLRARDPAEVPQEPGVCLDVGFIADDTGKFQEIFGIGLRFPELPDASFSISTNKDAQQGDSFEARRSEARRAALMVPELATAFAKIKTLREGKRKVQQGDGSEALFRRPLSDTPGHWHEFQFEYAGKRFDHRNPSWDAALFTGVERDQAGSVPSGLSDEEAVALWDRLMASVRLRVAK